MKSVNKFRLS